MDLLKFLHQDRQYLRLQQLVPYSIVHSFGWLMQKSLSVVFSRWWWCMQGESNTSRSRPCLSGWSGSPRSRRGKAAGAEGGIWVSIAHSVARSTSNIISRYSCWSIASGVRSISCYRWRSRLSAWSRSSGSGLCTGTLNSLSITVLSNIPSSSVSPTRRIGVGSKPLARDRRLGARRHWLWNRGILISWTSTLRLALDCHSYFKQARRRQLLRASPFTNSRNSPTFYYQFDSVFRLSCRLR